MRRVGRAASWALVWSLALGVAFSVAPVCAAAPPLPVLARPGPPLAKLVAADSELVFTARQIGVAMEGRFKRFDAQIALDPRQPQNGRVSLRIELGSVAINAETDAMLAMAPWFDTSRFPVAQFQSRAIKAVGPGRLEVAGRLTLKGVSREVIVPVALVSSGGRMVATGHLTLHRLDFKVGDGEWADPSVVADEVDVRFKLSLLGLPP